MLTNTHFNGLTNLMCFIFLHFKASCSEISDIFTHLFRKSLFSLKKGLELLSASVGVEAPAAGTLRSECVTVRIIAVSNPPGLRHLNVPLMCDNRQGDEQRKKNHTKP